VRVEGGPYTVSSHVRHVHVVVAAAVTEASDVADEGLIGPEWVAVWAVLWCPHRPRARSGPD
jgi:hypothetical protein